MLCRKVMVANDLAYFDLIELAVLKVPQNVKRNSKWN